MKQFVFRVCHSQTDQPHYIIHAMNRGAAEIKADEFVTECHANHWEYVCEIIGEVV